MKTDFYYVEITDVYGGEANYSWVTRHKIRARSFRGVASAISRRSGLSWHKVADYGDQARYDSASGATCFFVEWFDESRHSEYFERGTK